MINKALNDYRILIDNHINTLLPDKTCEYSSVINASRYSLLSGGKRIRPIILLEFFKIFGGDVQNALNFAVALEMIHTYSLIHDDLPCMDNDDMRRGRPSCHKKFSEDIALLAGDNLLTTAFSVAAQTNLPYERVVKAIKVLSDRANGMIYGQVMDLELSNSTVSASRLEKMHSLKTGCLISAAAEIGCILAGADENNISIAAKFAINLSLAFQIIDDILDIIGDEKTLGKPIGSDKDNDKQTYPTLFGLESAKKAAKDYTAKALEYLSMLDADTAFLRELTNYLLNRNY